MTGDECVVSRNSAGADDFAILCRSPARFQRIQRGGSARLLSRQGQKGPHFKAFEKADAPDSTNFVLFNTMQFARAQRRGSLGQGL